VHAHTYNRRESGRVAPRNIVCATPPPAPTPAVSPNPRGPPHTPGSTQLKASANASIKSVGTALSLPQLSVEGWGTDRDVPKAWWYKTGNDGLYQSEMTVCTRSAALTRLNRVAAGPSALSRERSSPRQRGTSPQRRPTMHEKRAAQVRSRARKIRVSCMAMGKVDRRNRPPGGPILSHWGAEEEV
jgi:hypothetical protein